MADNVAITAGAGTSIATKDRGAQGHEQIVIAGSLHVVQQQTPTISNGVAYTAGDCVGGLQTITNFGRFTGAGGMLQSVILLDKTQAQRAAIDLVFFDRTVTVAGDNNPFACSDADMAFCLGIVAIATGDYNTAWAGTPLNSVATKLLATPLPLVVNGTSLFCQAVTRGTPTYTSTSDLIFTYTWVQD